MPLAQPQSQVREGAGVLWGSEDTLGLRLFFCVGVVFGRGFECQIYIFWFVRDVGQQLFLCTLLTEHVSSISVVLFPITSLHFLMNSIVLSMPDSAGIVRPLMSLLEQARQTAVSRLDSLLTNAVWVVLDQGRGQLGTSVGRALSSQGHEVAGDGGGAGQRGQLAFSMQGPGMLPVR